MQSPSFLPSFAGKSAIFIAKSDLAGKLRSKRTRKWREEAGRAVWGKFQVRYHNNLVRICEMMRAKNVTLFRIESLYNKS